MKQSFQGLFLILLLLTACHSGGDRVVQKGRLLISQEEYEKARNLLYEGLIKHPGNLEMRYLYGWSLLGLGDERGALAAFAKCLSQDFRFYGGHKGMGAVYLAKNQLEEAQKEFQLALDARPDLPEIYSNLAEVKSRQGQHEAARQLLLKGSALQKQTSDFDLLLARNAFNRGQDKEAQEYLSQSMKKPLSRRVFEIQRDCLKSALETSTLTTTVSASLGKKKKPSAQQRKQLEGAREELSRCEKADPRHFQDQPSLDRLQALLK